MGSGGNSSLSPYFGDCLWSSAVLSVHTAWVTVYFLLLPVFLLVLYIGFNKWRRSAAGGLSHSDVFTLHMVLMETICIVSSCTVVGGYIALNHIITIVGGNIVLTTMAVQVLFHSLTCVERYLAVVHPVSYLRLRRRGGATLRNICISVVWVLSVGYGLPMGIINTSELYGVFGFLSSIAPLPLVSYCSICVLCVLIRPKPGCGGGLRKQMDQSKRSTVYTMVAILAALLLRLVVNVSISCVNILFWTEVDSCLVTSAGLWSALPSSLVLPTLFLHRAGTIGKARK